jgi:sodium/bile acid cotransporter 3/5
MLPLWIYTLGTQFVHPDTTLVIPFGNVASSLAVIVLPLVAGVFVKYKLPRLSKVITKVMKPITIGCLVILLSVGIYSNLFIFKMFKPRIVLAACMLPYLGYLIGGAVALICRLPWTRVKTVAIETGLQNTSIATVLMLFSFPSPEGDIASVAPVASIVMTPLPIFLITICYLIYKKCNPDKYRKVPKANGENSPTKATTDKVNDDVGVANDRLTSV